jgi:integrase
MAVKLLPDGRWICYYRKDGQLKKEYFGRGAEGEAAAWRRNDELQLARRRPPKEDYGPAFVELTKAYMRGNNFAPGPFYLLGIRLGANLLPHFGAMPAVRICDDDVDAYVRKRRGAGVKDATIRRELTDLKAILNWSARRKPPLIPFNPIRDYTKPSDEPPKTLRPPSDEEVARIFAHASAHLLRALKLAWFLGLRPGAVELLRLKWQDSVNWNSRTILVISARKGGPAARAVPIHPVFLKELKVWHKADGKKGPLVHYRGKPISSLKKTWWQTLVRAGIRVLDKNGKVDKARSRHLRMYDFRHRFVTNALEEGADMKALSEVVGSRPETLMRFYQHVAREVHRQTVEKITAPPMPVMAKPSKKKKVIPISRRASR